MHLKLKIWLENLIMHIFMNMHIFILKSNSKFYYLSKDKYLTITLQVKTNFHNLYYIIMIYKHSAKLAVMLEWGGGMVAGGRGGNICSKFNSLFRKIF